MVWRWAAVVACLIGYASLSGCAFLPGFSIFEDPAIYAFSVSDVANQVACELQAYMAVQLKSERGKKPGDRYKWVMGEDNITVHLNLQTDTEGYVNFTGVNVAQLGLSSLAQFISTQSKVSSLGAKVQGKRTRTVQINFSVSPMPFTKDQIAEGGPTYNCTNFSLTDNPATKLYLEEWLADYFERVNYDYQNKPIPNQLNIQSVELTSAIFLGVDVSGGATPNFLGNGSTFIFPINGLSLDYNPDYTNKIDMTLTVCDNSPTEDSSMPCFQQENSSTNLPRWLLDKQCRIYSYLVPLLSGVKPPKDLPYGKTTHLTCTKKGKYQIREDAPKILGSGERVSNIELQRP